MPQFALVREAVAAFNVASVEMAGFEADDLIATYTRQARAAAKVTIVSSDKDLMQLVGDGVEMLDPMKNRRIGPSEVVEKFGVGPERVVDVQALAGDSTDNVPGVPGIGVKTAAQLIGDYGDLDSLLARATEIKQPKRRQTLIDHAEMARVSRELVRLRDDVEVPLALHELVVQPPSDDTLLAFFKAQSFKRLIARLEGEMAQGGGDPTGGRGPNWRPPRPPMNWSRRWPICSAGSTRRATWAWSRWIPRPAAQRHARGLDRCLPGHSAGRACYIPLAHRAPEVQGDLDLAGPTAVDGPKQIPSPPRPPP